MSIKILLLKSGENIICDAKELISEEKTCGYLLKDPFRMTLESPVFLTETIEEVQDKSSIRVAFSPWILLTSDKEIPIPTDWVVTIVEPIESVKEMYEEKINEQNSKVSSFES
mgnify:CR=1 FL=1